MDAGRVPYLSRGLVWIALLLAGGGVLSGCGLGPKPSEVEGKVTFRGQPVTEGRIVFEGTDGYIGETLLDTNGSYALRPPDNSLPPGEYTVTITPVMVLDNSDPKTPPVLVEKRAPNIPEKYRRVGSTPLRAIVNEGKNELNFAMNP